MRKREKTNTAASRTADGIEWTTLKVKQDGEDVSEYNSLPIPLPEEITDENIVDIALPEELSEYLLGDLSVALRTSELLLRTMRFPTADPAEIAEMVGFQIDKVSPFPMDQLATAHEILDTADDTALVLMAATKRNAIDDIGDAFEKVGVNIHSIDVRALGWLRLLKDGEHLSEAGTEILILQDAIDFILVVLMKGKPVAFRSLQLEMDDMTLVDELTQEIAFTITTLDAEYKLETPTSIDFWSNSTIPMALRSKLAEKSGLLVLFHDLDTLPALSEGLLRRAVDQTSRIELIPREWIELQKRKKLFRTFSFIGGGIVAVWLAVLLIFVSVYKVRDMGLNRVTKASEKIMPAAKAAQENQNKLKALTAYTDRSDSSLECLREITFLLPAGDIEFISYNYKKGKGVTLRGTANTDDMVYDFFKKLTTSTLFAELKDQSVNTKTTKGVRRAIYSVTLVLAAEEEG